MPVHGGSRYAMVRHYSHVMWCFRKMSRYKRHVAFIMAVASFVILYIFIVTSGVRLTFRGARFSGTWKKKASVTISPILEPRQPQEDTLHPNPFLPEPRDVTTPSNHLSDEELARRFKSRRRVLRLACQRHRGKLQASRGARLKAVVLTTQGSLPNKVIYCPIPKTGSSTWKEIFKSIKWTQKREDAEDGEFLIGEHRRNISFTFVRDPYSRLLSAYVDKLFSPNFLFSRTLGRYIVDNFRQNATSLSLGCGFDVTFPEFIQYFIHMQRTGIKRDPHFVPTHEQCHMCEGNYTYIGHLETIKEDMAFILRAMHSPVAYNKSFDNTTIFKNVQMLLKRGREQFTPCMDLDEAARRLWKRWQIRGVIHKTEAFPLSWEESQNISLSSLTKAGLEALSRSGSRSSRIGQKREALREAFASISLENRLQVKRLLHLDFEMFGFDPEPEEVFPASSPHEKDPYFSYFDLYH